MPSIRMNYPRADRMIEYIETLRTPDGTMCGSPFRAREFQRHVMREVYAPEYSTGHRVVRLAILSMGKKNGKTSWVSGVTHGHLAGPEAVRNGQLYSMAHEREQAGILFNLMANMVYMDEELSARLNVIESRKQIFDPVSGSRFTALSGERKGKHGKSSSFLAFDELAEFGCDRSRYDPLYTSTGAHDEPMVWVFSTQSPDDKALLSQLIDDGLSGRDPRVKVFLYAVPDEADIWDEKNWLLANPALGDFRSLEELRDFAEKAKRMPDMEAAFRNLYLNQRVAAGEHFMPRSVWEACGGPPDEDAFYEYPVVAGLDLSGKNDLTALDLGCQDADMLIHVKPFFWTPEEGLAVREARDHAPYSSWVRDGYLRTTPGRTVDYDFVATALAEIHAEYNLAGVAFDRWRIDDLKRSLEKIGIDVWVDGVDEPIPGGLRLINHGQGFRDMSPAIEYLMDDALEARFRHGGHPVLTNCIANVKAERDAAGGRKFSKVKSTGRIDGAQALAMMETVLHGITPDTCTQSIYDDPETAVM